MARRSHAPRKTIPGAVVTTASVALLSAAALMSAWVHAETLPHQTYSTPLGQTRPVVIDEGIAAVLNTDSALAVTCSPHRCDVTLDRGEALFELWRTSSRSLRVTAGGAVVDAGRTVSADASSSLSRPGQPVTSRAQLRFSVRLRTPTQADVLVTAGPVTAGTRTINTNELARITRGGLTLATFTKGEALRRQDWITGHLALCGETLEEAVAEFNRYNRRKLVIADRSIARLTIGGKFHVNDIQAFTAALRPLGVVPLRGGGARGDDSIRLVSARPAVPDGSDANPARPHADSPGATRAE